MAKNPNDLIVFIMCRKILLQIFKFRFLLFLISFSGLTTSDVFGISPSQSDGNKTFFKEEIIRVVQPGVFDFQSKDFLIRMRAWGVSFPQRNQPGYNEAIAFTEKMLLSTLPKIKIKQEFDTKNLKVVEILLVNGSLNFSREAISTGVGWHLDKETNRYGPFVLSQLKAKRLNLGIWSNNFNYQQIQSPSSLPTPRLPGMINSQRSFVPTLSFWVTSFGKIHRPGCSFYQRGRGNLTSKPEGLDCRICGGRKSK